MRSKSPSGQGVTKLLSQERRASLGSAGSTNALDLPITAEFNEDLQDAYNVYLGLRQPSRRVRRKQLTDLINVTERWKKVFSKLDRFPVFAQDPKVYMGDIVRTAKSELANTSTHKTLKQLFGINGFDWFVGERLPHIYKKHTGLTPTTRDALREPNTPFVIFAERVLARLGITKDNGEPYARESIVKAMTVARKGGRHRGRSVSNR